MKYVILIHSNPQPWGHPTSDYIAEAQAQSPEQRAAGNAAFEATLTDLQQAGELIYADALGDPTTSRLYRWDGGMPALTDGPYAESKEHLAGFFVIDVESQQRAEEVARTFSGPGETIELRPVAVL
ncbi:MAG: YciI family protein [Lapillicoccus sp.]